MEIMEFNNPIHSEGLNFTIRRGTKWAKLLSIGDRIEVALPIGVAEAHILMIVVCRVQDVPAFVYQQEHDPQCRQEMGLLHGLDIAYEDFRVLNYPEKTMQIVSCIGYEILSWHLIEYQFKCGLYHPQ